MTILLYAADPYTVSFDAKVEHIRGEWIKLDKTAFYPGGGGQDPDLGVIEDLQVTEVKSEDGILHKVPRHALSEGQTVKCSIDWSRRYDLMKAHTGEHLLFSTLSKMRPGIELVKITIAPAKKSVTIRGDVDWNLILEAQRSVNDSVRAGLLITESWVGRDDPSMKETRVKLERIHGERIRVVQIGDLDRAACAGIHVKNTSEIGALLVTKLASAKPVGDYEIEFEVGDPAIRDGLDLASIELHSSSTMGSNPLDLVSALNNMKRDIQIAKNSLKKMSKEALKNIQPQLVGTSRLYAGLFDGADKKALMDAASSLIREARSACVFASRDDRLLLLVACSPTVDIDCVRILTEALGPVGGKGGGQRNFAMGGAPESEMSDVVFESATASVRKAIQSLEPPRT
ncbi:MAG: alanyl-tRNA editing protein [Methanomassiliicoccales archaeon]|nr:alanyl-tRNA editing protein [Methanomassiliicoccales archaeon]